MFNEETQQENSQFYTLFIEDQADRVDKEQWSTPEKVEAIVERDKRRLAEVEDLLQQDEVLSPDDLYYAAMIFQHGSSVEHFRRAHSLAEQSMNSGYEPAKWLYAASLDRLLVNEGKLQKFGTQYKLTETGEEEFYPCDPTTTDEERMKYNVKPLHM